MGAVSAVDDGLKRFYKYKPGREVEKFVQAKRYNNIRLKREVEDLAKILISVNFAPKKLISNDENKETFGKWGIFTISH